MDDTTLNDVSDATTPADMTKTTNQARVADNNELLDDELLVEEISIDGMCGVY